MTLVLGEKFRVKEPVLVPPVPTALAASQQNHGATALAAAAPRVLGVERANSDARKLEVTQVKPHFLGLLSTAVLLLVLAAAAVWASFFLDDGLASPFQRGDSATKITNDPVLIQPVSPRALTPQEAAAAYAATGIWQRAPAEPHQPPVDSIRGVYVASIDAAVRRSDAVALPPASKLARDASFVDPCPLLLQPVLRPKTAQERDQQKSILDGKFYGPFRWEPRFENVLFLNGTIQEGIDCHFTRAIDELEIQTLILNSPGGNLQEAISIANVVFDRRLATYVPSFNICESACAFLFFAGSERAVEGNLKVHAPYVEDKDSGIVPSADAFRYLRQVNDLVINSAKKFDIPEIVQNHMLTSETLVDVTTVEGVSRLTSENLRRQIFLIEARANP